MAEALTRKMEQQVQTQQIVVMTVELVRLKQVRRQARQAMQYTATHT